MMDLKQHHESGPNLTRQVEPHAHSAIITEDNQFEIFACLGIDELAVYRFDSQHSKFAPHTIVKTSPGAGPRHMVFHPSGGWLYVAIEIASTVAVFEHDLALVKSSQKNLYHTMPVLACESLVADIHIDSRGQYLYASPRGHNSGFISIAERDGALKLQGHSSCGGVWPRNFSSALSGRFVLVANQYSDEECVLPLNMDGGLGFPVKQKPIAGAACVKFT